MRGDFVTCFDMDTINRILTLLIFSFVITSCTKEIIQHKLTVNVNPAESGSITPPSNSYEKGQSIQLLATPKAEYIFKEWEGDLRGSANPSTLVIDKDKVVTGTFEKRQYPLNLTLEGSGTVKEEITSIASQAQYPSGTTIKLTAMPSSKSIFAGWSGDLTSNSNPFSIKIDKQITLKGVFSNEIPRGLKATPINYGIKLNWDTLRFSTIGGYFLYKGKNNSFSGIPIKVANLGRYTDSEVSIDVNYDYKLSAVDNNGNETERTEIISSMPLEPLNTSIPKNNEIGGINYAYIYLKTTTCTKISHQFTIYDEPRNQDGTLNKDGLYYQFYQGLLNDDIGFYYGIQTSVYNTKGGPYNKGLIFSRWGTRDINNYKLAIGGFGDSAGYEGDFIGVRINYDWKPGSYEIELKLDSTDNLGDWYGLRIRSLKTSDFTYVGSMRFEKGVKSKGIKSGGITWTELYFKANPNTPLPRWHISVDKILADNQEPSSIYIDYNKNKFVGFSNIYTTNKSDFHFLMGPKVKNISNSGIIWTK